jgi:lactoylglutathione lyase
MFAGVSHVNLVVSDLERSKAFYTEVLGLSVADEVEVSDDELSKGLGVSDAKLRAAFLDLPGNEGQIEMMEYLHPTPNPLDPARRASDVGWGHLAFRVDDVDTVYEQLRAKGVEFVSPPVTVPGGARFCWFKDPDGNPLEIITPS